MIQHLQLLHHRLADQARRAFPIPGPLQFFFDPIDGSLDRIARNRTFFESPQHACTEFLFGKRFPRAVGLDDARQVQLRDFEGGEAFFAFHAFPPAAHLVAFPGQTGIDDAGVLGGAIGAMHDRVEPLRGVNLFSNKNDHLLYNRSICGGAGQ
jgi:hypothetical protein